MKMFSHPYSNGALVISRSHVVKMAGAAMVLVVVTLAVDVRAQAPKRATCDPVDGLAPLLKPGTVAIFGEIHGTAESPAFVGTVMCHAAAAGIPVILGIEQASEMNAATDAFVHSSGTAADRSRLLAMKMWADTYQDGRASSAMLRLLDRAREMEATGARVRVVAFSETAPTGPERDRLMAANIVKAAAAEPDAIMIVLTGNLHSRMKVGVSFNAAYEPMGYLVRHQLADRVVYGFDVSYDAGSAWICEQSEASCGAHALKGNPRVARGSVEFTAAVNPQGYNGLYGVGAISAAEPAVKR
jgi:hypothetical protein